MHLAHKGKSICNDITGAFILSKILELLKIMFEVWFMIKFFPFKYLKNKRTAKLLLAVLLS